MSSTKCIIPWLKGGLGNQMFQIAAAAGLATKLDCKFGISYDIPHNGLQGYPHSKYRTSFYSGIHSLQKTPNPQSVKFADPEATFNYSPILIDGKSTDDRDFDVNTIEQDVILLDGYYQSHKYFADWDLIRNIWHFPENIKEKVTTHIIEHIKTKHSVSKIGCIQVRRGDYVRLNDTHPIQTIEYYREGIAKLQDYHGIEHFVVISDDPVWCTMTFKDDAYITVINTGTTNELFDLYLASQCDAAVISNSSFGWWGAFLGKPDKPTVAPTKWFGPGIWMNPKTIVSWRDIYCDNWYLI